MMMMMMIIIIIITGDSDIPVGGENDSSRGSDL